MGANEERRGAELGIWTTCFYAVPNMQCIREGEDLANLVYQEASARGLNLRSGDVIVVGCEAVSRAEGCTVCLAELEPSAQALDISVDTGWSARLCELYLRETKRTVAKPGVCISLHRLAAEWPAAGELSEEAVVVVPPHDANASATELHDRLQKLSGMELTVVISEMRADSLKQSRGSIAIGVSGARLTVEEANWLATAASMVARQANQWPGAVIVRGLQLTRR